MTIVTLSSKGQVTIPKKVRDALNLQSGYKLEFIVSHKGDVLIRPVTEKVDDVFGKLHKPEKKTASIEEMDMALKKRIQMKYK